MVIHCLLGLLTRHSNATNIQLRLYVLHKKERSTNKCVHNVKEHAEYRQQTILTSIYKHNGIKQQNILRRNTQKQNIRFKYE